MGIFLGGMAVGFILGLIVLIWIGSLIVDDMEKVNRGDKDE